MSSAQGSIGLERRARERSPAFAFVKATQGDYYTSNEFAPQWSGAKRAGLLRSAYHFFDPTIDGVAQAKYYLGVVGTLGQGDLPPMLDIECPTGSTQAASLADCEYGGASPDSGWVDAPTLNQRIHDWLDYVAGQTGRTPIVYSYNSWFQDSGVDSTTLAGSYPFFVSWPTTTNCYTVGAGNTFTSAPFWQWSVTGSCPGVTGTVDLDRFAGTLEQLRQLANLDVDAAVGGEAGAGDTGVGDAGPSGSGPGENGSTEPGAGDDASMHGAIESGANDEGGSSDAPVSRRRAPCMAHARAVDARWVHAHERARRGSLSGVSSVSRSSPARDGSILLCVGSASVAHRTDSGATLTAHKHRPARHDGSGRNVNTA